MIKFVQPKTKKQNQNQNSLRCRGDCIHTQQHRLPDTSCAKARFSLRPSQNSLKTNIPYFTTGPSPSPQPQAPSFIAISDGPAGPTITSLSPGHPVLIRIPSAHPKPPTRIVDEGTSVIRGKNSGHF